MDTGSIFRVSGVRQQLALLLVRTNRLAWGALPVLAFFLELDLGLMARLGCLDGTVWRGQEPARVPS
jgi:hypothetical protein